jgi:hypothetical protein
VAKYTSEQIQEAVREIARVAAGVFDGEECGTLLTPRAMEHLAAGAVPGNRFAVGDNIDYDAERFEAAKKLLLRLQRLAPEGLAVQCILWAPVPGADGKVVQEIFNGGPSRWPLSTDAVDLDEPMRQVMESGEPIELPPTEHGVCTVLAPVRNSLQDVTGFIEVSGAVPTEFGVQGIG